MKHLTIGSLIGALGVLVLLSFSTNSAYAANTDAGTTIGNTATVSYTVGSVSQTPIESSPTGNSTAGAGKGTSTDFKVDAKLLLTVVTDDTALISVVPGAASVATAFTVTNMGNQNQSAWLNAVPMGIGVVNPFTTSGSSKFDATNLTVYADTNENGQYDRGTDQPITSGNIPSLTKDGGSKKIFVVADIPLTTGGDPVVNGDFAVVGLTAQVGDENGSAITSDDSTATWTPGTVQQIFADPASAHPATGDVAYDGIASDLSGYVVNSANLTITKTVSVVSDPVSTSGNAPSGYLPKAIPGAVMMYTITVDNASGATQATGVSVVDDLSTQITAGTLAYKAGSIKISDPGNSNTPTACTDASDTDQCKFASNTVTVSSITLDGGEQAVITFEVTIP